MPAEWERHDATWIAWPDHEPDWPRKLESVQWVYAEIVRVLAQHERVELLCANEELRGNAVAMLRAHLVRMENVRISLVPADRVWLRDSGPSFVWNGSGGVELMAWDFNAWAKYDNYALDRQVPAAIQRITGLPTVYPTRPDRPDTRLVLEGGGIDVNGSGRMMVTEEWLLSDVQVRDHGMTRADFEAAFARYLGCTDVVWLGNGCIGDDTHGHIDDVARFVAPNSVVLAYEQDPSDANHAASVDNLRRLQLAAGPLDITLLPYPRPVMMDGQRLPASYANFYIANGLVLVPTFNDENDRVALDTIAKLFPGHRVVGIHAVDLVWGLGTLHCLTQQQPARALGRGA